MPAKVPFKHTIRAVSAEGAAAGFLKSRGRTVVVVDDTAAQVRNALERKLARVKENPQLYGDKIVSYQRILNAFVDTPNGRVDALLAHGDSRVDNPRMVGVMNAGMGAWIVFGYDFPES